MQVVILCGGYGTRIRDVSEDIPKPMIPIGGKPILWHIMNIYSTHGFTDFILCLGYKSWLIKRYFLDYHLAGADITLSLQSRSDLKIHSSQPLESWNVTLAETGLDAMTGCRVKRIEKYIRGDTFLLTYGDGVADVNISELLAFHHSHGKLATVTAVRPPSRFGEMELCGGRVLDFHEKALRGRGHVNGGFFVFHRDIFRRLEDDPTLVLEQEPLRDLANAEQLMAYPHPGFWQPMDNSRDYKYLNDLWDQGHAPWRSGGQTLLRASA